MTDCVCICSSDDIRRKILHKALFLHGIDALVCDGLADLQKAVGRRAPAIIIYDAKHNPHQANTCLRTITHHMRSTVKIVCAERQFVEHLQRVCLNGDFFVQEPLDPELIVSRVRYILIELDKKKTQEIAA